MRIVLSTLLFIHGVAHIVGFVVPWRLIESAEVPYRTTIVTGIDVGPAGIRILGLVWLIVALSFMGLAYGVQQREPWSYGSALALTTMSLVLCVLGWPESRPGVIVNVVILGLLLIATRSRWFPELVR